MSKFRDGMIGPTVVLLSICFVITFALAGVFNITDPVIRQQEAEAADAARQTVLEAGDTFTKIEGVSLPEGVVDAYQADNGAGYVFTSKARGFDGLVTYVVGIDSDGKVVGITMFDHSETPGLGTKIGDPAYLEKYYGDVDPNEVDAITGATRTSESLKNALKQAHEAFAMTGGL